MGIIVICLLIEEVKGIKDFKEENCECILSGIKVYEVFDDVRNGIVMVEQCVVFEVNKDSFGYVMLFEFYIDDVLNLLEMVI